MPEEQNEGPPSASIEPKGRAAFFAIVRAGIFGGKMTEKQVSGCEFILDACEGRGVPKAHTAYILATAFHETAHTMQPITEYGSEKYLKGKKYWPYIGRGFVQITWVSNYRDWSKRLGVDLVANPDLALKPDHAVRILIEGMQLGTFTGKKLSDYINDTKRDFVNARRIVNGTDKSALIAGYAEKFLTALS